MGNPARSCFSKVPRMRFPLLITFLLVQTSVQGADEVSARRIPAIALGCTGCHGDSGEGSGAIPGINVRPEAELLRALQDFRSNQEGSTVMNRIARGLSEQDLAALAKYFGRR